MSKSPIKVIWDSLSNATLVRFLLFFAAGWAFIQLLAYFETLFVIFIVAAILAFLLDYPVRWLNRLLPRTSAVIAVFLISLLVLVGVTVTLGVTLLSQAQQLVLSIQEFLEALVPWVQQLEAALGDWNIPVNLDAIGEHIQDQVLFGLGTGLAGIQILLTNVVHVILIAVVAFFMLLDGKRLWYSMVRLLPEQWQLPLTIAIRRNFLGFFWGRALLSLFFGASTLVVLLVLHAPFALILAVIAGVFDLIPGIGATLGISLVALLLLPESVWLAIKVLIGCVLLQQVEENLLMPRIMKGSLNINPVVMFFALLVGVRVAGLIGLFLAVPITGVMVSILEAARLKQETESNQAVSQV